MNVKVTAMIKGTFCPDSQLEIRLRTARVASIIVKMASVING
jgi:hypothetical protein